VGGENFSYESVDALYAALAALPALESVKLGTLEVGQADENNLANPERLTELLKVPTLWFVSFPFHKRSLASNSERIGGRRSDHRARLLELLVFCRRKCCNNSERFYEKHISGFHQRQKVARFSACWRSSGGSPVKLDVIVSFSSRR
jgi:hypothetical protein